MAQAEELVLPVLDTTFNPIKKGDWMTDLVEWLVEQITDSIRAGRTTDEACKRLCLQFPEDAVKIARFEFEKRTGRIRTMKEPTSLKAQGLSSWYPGPSPEDRFWPALRRLVTDRGWTTEAVDSIDQTSTKVVSLLPPPGLGSFDTRGLVLGYVQSGKTANYSAVIAKAADVGYRFFIVLSGVTNPLRRQTQIRLERELVNLNRQDWHPLTTAGEDFRLGAAGNADAFLTDHHAHRVLCVVKKNPAVLRRLLRWLKSANKDVLGNCPVLIIDDEADQASVNGGGSDDRRTAINRLILDLLSSLPKAAYVGYTATPFANILIDPMANDLYPRDFIVNLPMPGGYFGPERIYGRERLTLDEPEDSFDGLDMIRIVPTIETSGLKPRGQNDRATFEPELTPSLVTALRYFWLATAARASRGDHDEDSTMLIHTSLYTDVHQRFLPLIDAYRRKLLTEVRGQEAQCIEDLRRIWVDEQAQVPSAEVGEIPTAFDELLPYLSDAIERSEVVVENSRSERRLVYGEVPRVQIVIGGNTLARGLTLEGLVVSFFVRASTAYDTLLQMGRWFGYRPKYADLPRIWMTEDLERYFYYLATVEQEMRNDIKRYDQENLTPRDFAIRVRTHPALAITAQAKMQAAIDCDISYSRRRLQTILFNHEDLAWLTRNVEATRTLVELAHDRGIEPQRRGSNVVLCNVPVDLILSFLHTYSFHKDSQDLRSDLLCGYIEGQNRDGALKQWNVVVVGRKVQTDEEVLELGPGLEVPLLTRSKLHPTGAGHANLKAITSRVDMVADLDTGSRSIAGMKEDDLWALRPKGAGAVGLLLLYPISKDSMPDGRKLAGKRARLDAVEHLIGVGLVFPEAVNDMPLRYKTVDLSQLPREELEWNDEEEVDA